MKRLFIWAAVFLFVIGLGVVTFWDVPQWRLYDKDWNPLAMTEAENYCTATVGLGESFKPNSANVQRCMDLTQKDNVTHSIAMSTTWACEGIRDAGWDGTLNQCKNIIDDNGLWMIAGGGLATADSWSDSHPRPVATVIGELPEDRSNRGGDDVTPNYDTP